MKRFLAIYIGTEAARERAGWNKLDEEKRKALKASGVKAWMEWGRGHNAITSAAREYRNRCRGR